MPSEGYRTRKGRTDSTSPAHPATAAARLCRIEIENYKALDHLAVDIPPPTMPGDPDIFVVGSKNGVGKTSFLECCALIRIAEDKRALRELLTYHYPSEVLNPQLIRAGADRATITGIHAQGKDCRVELWDEDYSVEPGFDPDDLSALAELIQHVDFVDEWLGRSPNCMIHDDLLFFHSFRKVAEGPVRLKQTFKRMVDDPPPETPSILLKQEILRNMMTRVGLFEDLDRDDAEHRISRLNDLLQTFAGGRVDKLRSTSAEHVDIRIAGPGGASFSFDGLSSGQKEIVSTLFLIWNETQTRPGLVLIDEPELHLNPEWQREFIRHLHTLAPRNQYILATHSEDIFASVSEERRVLLVGAQG